MALPQPAPADDWTVETLRQHVVEVMAHQDQRTTDLAAANQRLMAEMDLRYQQRYDAQIKALDAALLAAEKAVQSALTAAQQAVAKAETAAEKRFESVNEFRAQLSDQANTFVPRAEYEARMVTVADKISEMGGFINTLAARIDLREGRSGGQDAARGNMVTIVGLALTAVTVLVGIYLAFRK